MVYVWINLFGEDKLGCVVPSEGSKICYFMYKKPETKPVVCQQQKKSFEVEEERKYWSCMRKNG